VRKGGRGRWWYGRAGGGGRGAMEGAVAYSREAAAGREKIARGNVSPSSRIGL